MNSKTFTQAILCALFLFMAFLLTCCNQNKATYIGTWRNVSGGGIIVILDNGSNLSIRDERGQVFNGTVDRDGNLQTNMTAQVSTLDAMQNSLLTHRRPQNSATVTMAIIELSGHLGCFPSDVDVTQIRRSPVPLLAGVLKEYERVDR